MVDNHVHIRKEILKTEQGQGHWKQFKMLKVNGAHEHGTYEKIWFEKFVCKAQR